METPSSTKRITRSQTRAALKSNIVPIYRKIEDSDEDVSRSRRRRGIQQQDRSALMDITNDSPISGLAMGSLQTPSSVISKSQSGGARCYNTPGSGEALLRGQVKALLQEVEKEAVLSKLSLENRPFHHLQGSVESPMELLAPTPANTPQLPNLSGNEGVDNTTSLAPVTSSLPVIKEQLQNCQMVSCDNIDGKKQKSLESQKSLTRLLLLDFHEKSESSDSSECSSVLTSESKDKSSSSPTVDDDNASDWSIQVNASTTHLEEDEEDQVTEEDNYFYYSDNDSEEEEEKGKEDDDGAFLVDELCEGISKMSVNQKTMPKFTGKHTRFEYNSDGELVGEVESKNSAVASPIVLHLKGLPTPKGKHLRFQQEEEEEM